MGYQSQILSQITADKEEVDPFSDEHRNLTRYYRLGHPPKTPVPRIQIFRIERRQETGKIETAISENKGWSAQRFLLWHGSPVGNFLEILAKGLGNGGTATNSAVWFAMFSAISMSYCQKMGDFSLKMMLLCEVLDIGSQTRFSGYTAWRDAEYLHSDLKGINATNVDSPSNGSDFTGCTKYKDRIRLRYLFLLDSAGTFLRA